MKKKQARGSQKYTVKDPAFDDEHGILRNKLGILDPRKLAAVESRAAAVALDTALRTYESDHRFTVDDVLDLHRLFLGDIYEWAGTYRTVDLSSADIRWCHAQYIPREMQRIDKLLRSMTPFHPDLPRDEMVDRLAQIHGELVVVHPFRDGNGRTTRILGNLLLVQAGHKPLRMESFEIKDLLDEYYAAIREVWNEADYARLKRFLSALLEKR